jgi:hypothetical protein
MSSGSAWNVALGPKAGRQPVRCVFRAILCICMRHQRRVLHHSSRNEIEIRNPVNALFRSVAVVACGLFLVTCTSYAQQDNEPGHSIGKVSIQQELIVLELNDGALGTANLFDLNGRTLRFTPVGSKYKVESLPLRWDSNYGPEFSDAEVSLHNFAFPFSGKSWKSFRAGTTGSIRFGISDKEISLDPYGHRDGGIILDRFDRLAEAADKLIDKAPAICVFLKPRLSGFRYVNELSDRVVITWDLTEPFGGLLDFTWFKTINRFQAVLKRDGSIEMSYKELAAKDAIVGIYAGAGKPAAVHFSSLSIKDGPFTDVYESFHYLGVPKPQDLSCTLIKALGDKFDFLAYYSDFRMDSQEGSPPSDGPVGGKVTGIGQTQHDQTQQALDSRCTQGRFQLGFAQPVYVGANEMQERPPGGAPAGGSHDIGFHLHQHADQPHNVVAYNYAVGHLGHEVGHRWAAYVSAKINGETVSLGEWPHWSPGLQSRVAFPYSLPIEASTLGGGAWQDNFDGTYTQIRDGFFVPATGYSYLDLYLMGLIASSDVPDFFLLKNLVRVGEDKSGHPIFRAERNKVTIQDVIAAEGPRFPDVYHSQRKFNTGIVVVVEHGKSPSPQLLEQANAIRQQWIKYWDKTTDYRASMTANPR